MGLFHHTLFADINKGKEGKVDYKVFVLACGRRGGVMVSALDCGSRGLDSSLAGVSVLCSWAGHFTLTVPLFTQEYKWVLTTGELSG